MELPPQLPENLQMRVNIVSAYNVCLNLEREIKDEAMFSEKERERPLVLCRILGYLLYYIPDVGLDTVAIEIQSCSRDRERLLQLGETYLDHFIRPFWSNAERTPSCSSPDNNFHHSLSKAMDLMNEPENVPQSHETAKTHALVRDGFQCVITKTYDTQAVADIPEIQEKYLPDVFPCMPTCCTHILPESLNAYISDDLNKEKYNNSVWTVLEKFGYHGIQEELEASRIHRLDNVLSLRPDMFHYFEKLAIWLTPTHECNKYKLEHAPHLPWSTRFPEFVTFKTPNKDKLPLPSPLYLEIHATCAKVASHSGASIYLDEFRRNLDEDEEYNEALEDLWQEILSSELKRGVGSVAL